MGKRGPKAKAPTTPRTPKTVLGSGPTLRQCTLDMVELIGNINTAHPVFYTGCTYYADFAVLTYIHNGSGYTANIDPDQSELFEELMMLLKLDALIEDREKISFKDVIELLQCSL